MPASITPAATTLKAMNHTNENSVDSDSSSSSSSHSSEASFEADEKRLKAAEVDTASRDDTRVSPIDKPHLLRPPRTRTAQASLALLIARVRAWHGGTTNLKQQSEPEEYQPKQVFQRVVEYVDFQRSLVLEDLCAEIAEHESRAGDAAVEKWRVFVQSEEADGASKLVLVSMQGSLPPHSSLQKDDVLCIANCQQPAVVEQIHARSRCFYLRIDPSVSLHQICSKWVDCYRVASGTTARRELEALQQIQTLQQPSRDAILRPGHDENSNPHSHLGPASNFASGCCHKLQRKALVESSRAREGGNKPLLVHGPPGTGKTHTILLLLSEELHHGGRVKVCAPSNAGVDEIVLRLLRDGIFSPDGSRRKLQPGELVRVGPNEAVSQSVVCATPEKILQDGDCRKKQQKASLIQNAQVVACTNSGSAFDIVPWQQHFSLMVMDEAAQATEPSAVLAMEGCSRVIFAGDHLQLPPTVQLGGKAGKALRQSLFERMMKQKHSPSVFLGMQFRMVPQIATLISELFYKDTSGHIRSSDSARAQQSMRLSIGGPVIFAHVAGLQRPGEGKRKRSLWNQEEARAASQIVNALLTAGVKEESIGIITPYAAQQEEMREHFSNTNVETDTIDGFQGTMKLSNTVSSLSFRMELM